MLGPSGCGKTTTLRMIAGFETPTEGAIRLEGVDVSRVPPHKRNVNTVFQHYALFPHMTVWDNVAYGPRSMKKDKAEVRRRVDEILGDRAPHRLRQAQARPAVRRPAAAGGAGPGAGELPERAAARRAARRAGLEAAPSHAIRAQAIQREVGITFVYVTHDQEEALTMSDRIAVMNAGDVEQIGSPTEIYDRPATVFVASFIGQANLWAGPSDREEQSCPRRSRGSRNDIEGPPRGHHDRARRPGHAHDPSGARARVDGAADRRRRNGAGHGP